MNPLSNYTPLFSTYEQLWAKYGPKPSVIADCFHSRREADTKKLIRLIASQEESVKWSLRLKDVLETLAKEQDRTYEELLRTFSDAVKASNDTNKLIRGLSAIGDADDIIERFQLFFRLSSMDDLFLTDESEINSVMIIE